MASSSKRGVRAFKILDGYFSETGNTRRVAEAIGAEATAGGHDVHVKPTAEVSASTLADYDVVFLGSTCHSSDVAAPVKDILNGVPAGSRFKLAGFVTHATMMPEGAAWHKQLCEPWAGRCPATFKAFSRDKAIDFLGFFHCQGAPNPQIEEFIRSTTIPDEGQWAEYIEDARKHPTPKDVEDAKAFARRTLAK